MDQEEAGMTIKKAIPIFALFIFLIFVAGCETIKGAFTGTAEGMQKDWKAMQGIDAWMRENLW